MKPLEGLIVLDLGPRVSSSFCCKIMAMLGAEVIKVEAPQRSDQSHGQGGELHKALRLYLDTSKKSITLDLNQQAGSALLSTLTASCDVLVHSYHPRQVQYSILNPSALTEKNPRIIVTAISDFGSGGAYEDYAGSSIVGLAMSGYMYLSGERDREPLMIPGEQPEYHAGLYAYIATMAALWSRTTTGKGCQIEIAMQEAVASLSQFTIVQYTYSGSIRTRHGNLWENSHPLTIWPCQDGHIGVCAAGQDAWERLCQMMDKPELIMDPRFAGPAERHANARELDSIVSDWLTTRTRQEVFHLAEGEWRVPMGPLYELDEVLADPQLKERGFWVKVPADNHPELLQPGLPFVMSDATWEATPAPTPGAHNEEVFCRRLGLTPLELEELRSAGIV